MDCVRFGIVGTGGMGRNHGRMLKEIPRAKVTACCDVNEETVRAAAVELGSEAFADPTALLDSGLVDAVVIATPHWQHPDITIAAFERGIHVMCEKPIAVTVGEADRMIEAHRKSESEFGVMFQWRSSPLYQRARELVRDGALGEIYRTALICSHFRSQAYYDSGDWRATWSGEGGGVLLNQAPHNLDMFAWIAGLPSSALGRCETRMHRIEVEDVASALLRYPNGAHGYIHTSTVEFPGTDITEFCGDSGKLTIQNNSLRLARVPGGIRAYSDGTSRTFGGLKAELEEILPPAGPSGHAEMHRNFVAAILDGEPLLAPGEESVGSVEIANAMILSSAQDREVPIPVPRQEYARFIEDRIAEHPGRAPA
jgi:predicted dehydrogenase